MDKQNLFQLTITYNDDKTANVIVPEKDIEKIYYMMAWKKEIKIINEETKMGFWTDFANIKHIIISLYNPEEKQEEKKEEDKKD